MRRTRFLAIALGGVAIAGQAAESQNTKWLVSPRAGFVQYARESSLKPAPLLGVDASYYLHPMLAIGTNVSIARSNTRGEDFIAALNFGNPTDGDTTLYFEVSQPVTVFDAGLSATGRMEFGALSPFVVAGVGVYTLYVNPQVSTSARRHSRMSTQFGGGVDIRLGNSSSVQLAIRDQLLTWFKREHLNPTDPRFTEVRFQEDIEGPPAVTGTLHNFQYSIGFSFRPGSQTPAAGGDDR